MLSSWWFRLLLLAVLVYSFYTLTSDGITQDDVKIFIGMVAAVLLIGGVLKKQDIRNLFTKKITFGKDEKEEK